MSLKEKLLQDTSTGLELSLSLSLGSGLLSSSDSSSGSKHRFSPSPPFSADLSAPPPTPSFLAKPATSVLGNLLHGHSKDAGWFPRVVSTSSLFCTDRNSVVCASTSSSQQPSSGHFRGNTFAFNHIPCLSAEHLAPSHTVPLFGDALNLGGVSATSGAASDALQNSSEPHNYNTPTIEEWNFLKKRKIHDGKGIVSGEQETGGAGCRSEEEKGEVNMGDEDQCGATISDTPSTQNLIMPQLQLQNHPSLSSSTTTTFVTSAAVRSIGISRSRSSDTFLSAFGSSMQDAMEGSFLSIKRKWQTQKIPFLEAASSTGSNCISSGPNCTEKGGSYNGEASSSVALETTRRARFPYQSAVASFASTSTYPAPHSIAVRSSPYPSPNLPKFPYAMLHSPSLASDERVENAIRPDECPPSMKGEQITHSALVGPTENGNETQQQGLYRTPVKNSTRNEISSQMHRTSSLSCSRNEPDLPLSLTQRIRQGQGGFTSPSEVQGNQRSQSSGTVQQIHNHGIEPNNATRDRVVGGQSHQPDLFVPDGSGDDVANIQIGIAPGLKFSGTGTTPDLPWVHTTAPNGHSINGVLYRFSPNQLQIVCACHGKHMSPSEFSKHAISVNL